jgi:hypothetical protein
MRSYDYQASADLIELHKEEIAVQVARQIYSQNLAYFAEIEQNKLNRLMASVLVRIAQYLKNGELQFWNSYIDEQSKFLQENGMPPNDFVKLCDIVLDEIKFFVRQAYPGEEYEALREKLAARLQGLYTIGILSSLNNSLRKVTAA